MEEKMDHTRLPRTGFLRLPQVLALIPVSKTTWWAGIKAGRYPAGVKISSRVTAWRAEDVAALLMNGPLKK
jgi:predicted DNA-binding transcriptional regulator AlpA